MIEPVKAGPRSRWVALARAVLALGLISFVLRRVDLSSLLATLGRSALVGLGGGTALLLLSQLLAALRWRWIIGPSAPPWRVLSRFYLFGSAFNPILPGSVGGDAVRIAALTRETGAGGEALASVILDRLLGVAALLLLAVVALIIRPGMIEVLAHRLDWHLSQPALLAGGALLLLLLGGIALASPRLRRRCAELLAPAWSLGQRLLRSPGLLLRVLALSLMVQSVLLLLWGLLARELGIPVDIILLMVGVPVVSLAAMLPISIAGLGIREGVWLVLLTGRGIPPETIVAWGLLYFGCTAIVAMLGGLVLLVDGSRSTIPP